jgi:RNA polymerase sporulation-specific sigma factor
MYDKINDLIAKNTGLIYKQLIKFGLKDDPEAISLGYEALYKALCTFKTEKKIKFSTYASVCIYNALGTYVRSLNKIRRIDTISYNALVNDSEELGEFIRFMPSDDSVEAEVIHRETSEIIAKALQDVQAELMNDTHKKIFEAWSDSGFTATTVDIANKVGISQSYASQILCRIKNLLRKRLKSL